MEKRKLLTVLNGAGKPILRVRRNDVSAVYMDAYSGVILDRDSGLDSSLMCHVLLKDGSTIPLFGVSFERAAEQLDFTG